MNQLQNKELELLGLFVDVCKKLNLKYFLLCGSALGAVKYNGFIPWDDDVDVGLYREDYEIFIKEAPKLLPKHIFLQNYKTDPSFPQIFSKLRNSETAYIEKTVAHLPINHGIYIDIFPLDGYPEESKEQKVLEKKKTGYKRQLACVFETERGFVSRTVCFLNRLRGCHKRTRSIAEKYDSLVKGFSVEGSTVICNHGNWQGKLEYAPKEQYGKGAVMNFEGLEVTVPEKYDEYLTQKYGDWRAELPVEEQVGHHYYEIMDTEKSYKTYLK